MPGTQLTTIQCPNCGQTLPGLAAQCQFCGTQLGKNVQRPPDAYKYVVSDKKTWQEMVYTILALLWIAQGGFELLQAFKIVPNLLVTLGGGGYVGVYAAFHVFMGIGLLTEQTWAQFVAKIICWINLPFAVLGYLFLFAIKHPLIPFFLTTFNVGMLVLQLYVIAVVGDA